MRYDITSPEHQEAVANTAEFMQALMHTNHELEAELEAALNSKRIQAVHHQREAMNADREKKKLESALVDAKSETKHYKRWAKIFLGLAILNAIAAFLMRY